MSPVAALAAARLGMAALAAAALLAAVPPATAGADDVRLRGLDPTELLFAAGGPDRTVAGDLVVAASTEHVFGWPAGGGPARRLGKLPDLGDATNDIPDGGGFVRIEAAQPGRVVVVRGEGRALSPEPERGPGHRVVVGPPEGPFADPAGCGERSGGPAGLSGDLLAYVAAPATVPACRSGQAPAVGGPAVVVRDLAGGTAVTRVLPLPFDGSVAGLRFDGPFVGLELRRAPEDPDADPERPPARALAVFDVRTGAEVTRVPTRGEVPWDLGPEGALVRGRYRDQSDRSACLGRTDQLRVHAPGDPAGRPLAGETCGFPGVELRAGGVLRLSLPLPDRRVRVVDRPLDGGPDRELATIAGPLAGGDDRYLVVNDPTCREGDARVVALGGVPASPAGPLACPVRVRAPRVARSGRRLAVRVACPLGCRAAVELQIFRPAGETTFGFGPVRVNLAAGASRTIRFRLPRRSALRRSSRGRLSVRSAGPAGLSVVRRRIVVRPAS